MTPAGPLQQPSISVDPSAEDEDDEEKDTVTELPVAHLHANKVRFDPGLFFNISGRDISNSLAAETQEEREADVTLLGEKARDRMSSTVLVNGRKSIYTIEEEKVVRAKGKKRLLLTRNLFILFFIGINASFITIIWVHPKYWYICKLRNGSRPICNLLPPYSSVTNSPA